jgi:3-deoxy-manno-octulosonate cytidylyltransferase (CMP-KDO synthetase)
MKAIGIIPARFQSTRFPGKPLALLGGKPMLHHVYENVVASGLFDKIVIATDDNRIAEAAKAWDADVVMTSDKHPSGTDRCAEVMEKMPESYDVVVNIQGDEPFINKKPLAELLQIFENHENARLATLVHKIEDAADIDDPNTAKVVLSANIGNGTSKALYFSRSPIPFIRSVDKNDWMNYHVFWKHIGLYAYRPDVLQEIVKLSQGQLEKAESLEQLRWLENGYEIYVAETDYKMLSVDTPEDLKKAENFLNTRGSFI